MTKVNLSIPVRQSGTNNTTSHATRLMALAVLIFINSALTMVCPAQRTDNRRLFWTGSNGSTWDNSTASWMTTGSFLAYAASSTTNPVEVWLTTNPITGKPITADPNATFIAGDVAIFDSWADQGWIWTGSSWRYPQPDPDNPISIPDSTATRTINIANEGVRVSDVVVSGPGSFVFTGGAITADPSFIAPDSVQVTGTGTGYAANAVRPTGALIKRDAGTLTLSNTAANYFAGGIHLLGGVLSITDNRALGNNNIITAHPVHAQGAADGNLQKHLYGELLFSQVFYNDSVSGGIQVPAVVLDSSGQLMNATYQSGRSLHIAPEAAGIDITGDIYIGNTVFTFNIEGETTVSGRILSNLGGYGATNGAIVKTGPGTLILTSTHNMFYASGDSTSQILEGRLVTTTQYALGTGPFSIDPGAFLEFRGAAGTFRQAFVGGGNIEVTQSSDVTFNWRYGVLSDYDNVPTTAPANNNIKSIIISGSSRFTAIASGTYSTVLGGASVYVEVTDSSALVVGREGISYRGTGGTRIPMNYAILANRIDLVGSSTLVLNPNAYLSTGALLVTDTTTTCAITFGGSGVSRLRWQEGVDPDTIAMDLDSNNPDVRLRYVVPHGMELIVNTVDVPLSSQESVPADNSPSGWCREYVVVNQGANPLNDIAQTFSAISVVHDTISTRLADDFLDPVTRIAPSRGRKWVNSAWMRYMHTKVDYDASSITTPGINGRIDGAVIGMNGILPGRVLLGGYAGFADNSLDTTNDTNFASKQKFIGVHAAQKLGKFYVAVDAATGRVNTDSIRNEPAAMIRAKWDTSYYSGDLQVGAILTPWQQTVLKPYAGLRYTKLKLSKYEERGTSPLMIDDFDDSFSQVIYGLVASRKFVVFKRDLSASLSIGRKQAVSAPRESLETYFFDSPGTPVHLKRGDYYQSLTTFGLSARMAVSSHTQVGIAGEYETASSRTNTTFSALVGYSW